MHKAIKIILFITAAVAIALALFWFQLDKHVRYLILNAPKDQNVLFWTVEQRNAGFRSIESLPMIKKRLVSSSQNQNTALPKGAPIALDNDKLKEVFETQQLAGLVVIHKGKIRLEQYGLGMTRNDKWTSFSVAKSFTSTLVGAAIKDGYIDNLDDKVSKYITDMRGSPYDEVSIKQLLSMTSGIDWNEDYSDPNSDVSKFNFNPPEPGVDSTVSYMRKLDRAVPAGSKWLYSTGETNLIGVLISEASGKTLSDYLTEKIWLHLPVEHDASWVLGPSSHEISGCCIQASTHDFAVFGHFVMTGAMVEGESILPDGFLQQATSKQADIGRQGEGYGYQWWTNDDGSFEGKGIFGQGIFIDPALELVIALNSNWPAASDVQLKKARSQLYSEIRKTIKQEQIRN